MNNKITIKNSVKILDDNIVIKKKNKSLTNTFTYLKSRSFNNFPKIIKEEDNYIYYEYIKDIKEPKEQKIIDLVNTMTILHNKTTISKEIDIDNYKYIYESINTRILDTYNYYNKLMDNIELETYMSPSNYLIARNISHIYNSLNYAKEHIDMWYKLVENKRKIRVVTIHNNISLDHYLKADKPYLISWDKSNIDIPIYDLISLYKHHYLDFDFTNILNIYLNKYPLSKEEMLLFLTIISIPDKIITKDSEYQTVLEVRRIIDYIYKTNTILKEYRIEQKENKS